MGFCGSQRRALNVSDAAGLGAHGEGHSVRGAGPAGAKSGHKQLPD